MYTVLAPLPRGSIGTHYVVGSTYPTRADAERVAATLLGALVRHYR